MPWTFVRRGAGSLVFLLFVFGFGVTGAQAQSELYVANGLSDSVTVYAATASGDVAPVRTIAGALTLIDTPTGIAVDGVHNELFVANFFDNSITVYTRTANGNVAPLRRIAGALTGLDQPRQVALDLVNDELFVANGGGDSILVFSRTADGDVAPLRTITLAAFDNPRAIAVDTVNNEIFVLLRGPDAVAVYSRTANGAAAALRTIAGGNTGIDSPEGMSVDLVNNEVFVANAAAAVQSVTVYNRTDNGNVFPLRTLAGALTGFADGPAMVLADPTTNQLFVSDGVVGASAVKVFTRTASGDVAPLRILTGPATDLANVAGLALSASAAVPTLDEWAQVGMLVLLATIGLWAIRRRRCLSRSAPPASG
jgi:DNA-binding beta-propeller fold protein YncE